MDDLASLKIYDYTKVQPNSIDGFLIPPIGLNIKYDLKENRPSIRETIFLGERIKTEVFASYDVSTNTYSDLLFHTDYSFNRDADNYLADSRDSTLFWYDINGDVAITETKTKFYQAGKQQLDEVKKRRENLYDELIERAENTSLYTLFVDLLSQYESEVNLYLKAGTSDLVFAIQNDPNTDLDVIPAPTPEIPNPRSPRQVMTIYFSLGVAPGQ